MKLYILGNLCWSALILCLILPAGDCNATTEPSPSVCDNSQRQPALNNAIMRILLELKNYKDKECLKEANDKGLVISQHILKNTLTWSSSQRFCQGFGASLCTVEQVCPNGKGPVYGVITGDSWTPVGGITNNWIQTGNKPHVPCTQTGTPSWGQSSSALPFKGRVYCCKAKSAQKHFEWTHYKLGDTITWSEAQNHCTGKGYSLCRAEHICNNGKPLTGVLTGDHWTPTGDITNEWIQIGDHHPPCLIHSTYGPPGWGQVKSKLAFKGNVFCCKDEPSRCTVSDTDEKLCPVLANTNHCDSEIAQKHCCKSCPVCQGADKGKLCYLVNKRMCENKNIMSTCCKTCKSLI